MQSAQSKLLGDVKVITRPSTANARKGTPEIKMERILVTPEMAEGWLAKNTINRPVQHRVVTRYARDLQEGRWRFTGDAIRFDVSGAILDGQHRLLACVRAGAPFETLVIDGLQTELRDYLDMGFKRTTGNALHFRGFVNGPALAAAAQWLVQIRSGKKDGGAAKSTTPEILSLVDRHPGLPEATKLIYGQDSRKNFILGPPPSLMIALYYICADILGDDDRASAFLGVFQTGKPDYDGDPAQVWRERLIRYRATGITVRRDVHYAGLVHAWNMFRDREATQKFKVPNEATIKGLDVRKL